MGRVKVLVALFFALLIGACAQPAQGACLALQGVANGGQDASAALLACIDQTPPGERLEVPPGTYTLRKQIRILKPITIVTAGIADDARPCDRLAEGTCATFRVDLDGMPNPNIMPIEAAADRIEVNHLILEGVGNPKIRNDCSLPDRRPLGGGMRVLNSYFTMRNSVLRNFSCYTTMEVLAGVKNLTLEENLIGPNGDHRPGDIWSDGITVLQSEEAVIRRNRFVDNTDVQLILGGCRKCRIEGNIFRHTGVFTGASFAELMLQAFPSTTGDYTGALVTANDIDCGPSHRCGFGIMVGSNPWKSGDDPRYPGAMFGGAITNNKVRNAKIGINIDSPTGPVTIQNNDVVFSGGSFGSDCGTREWPAVNIAETAAQYIRGDPSNQPEGQVDTTRCIINRHAN